MRAAMCVILLCASAPAEIEWLRAHRLARAARVAAVEAPPGAMPASTRVIIDPPRPHDATAPRASVRIYSSTTLDADAQRTALDVAKSTFHAASIEIDWTICAEEACDRPPAEAELSVRMVFSGDPRPGRLPLGEAVIDRQAGKGVLATVYVDRTLRLARQLALPHDRLLGRTLAHEIGHLLLASTTHGSGLMREVWLHRELTRPRQDDWALNPIDAVTIRRRLSSQLTDGPRPFS